jgi:eukaryotic-like serine/threonine-protein kinase
LSPRASEPPRGPSPPGAPATSRYEILARIATGGMATVYVGRLRGAIGFSRLVAIKRPHLFLADDPALRAALGHEARVASQIHHPHVVSVLDVEATDHSLALILDYVEGGTLADLFAYADQVADPIPAGVALRIALDVASGLHAAHALRDRSGTPLGIVHRDVSPQNILVGLDGQARLTDFGIAKVAAQIEHTATDILKGKLGYLAPEYVAKRDFDIRSDEYALAVVTWEALAGQRLFKGKSESLTLRKILEGHVPPLATTRPLLAPLDEVLLKALSRDPRARYESVEAFAEALEQRARQHGWVAPYSEVAMAVEMASGERATETRMTVETSEPRPMPDRASGPPAGGSVPPPRPQILRDEVATRSLIHPPSQPPPPPSTPPSTPPKPSRRALPPPKRTAKRNGALALVVVVAGALVVLGLRARSRDAAATGASSPQKSARAKPSAEAPSDDGTSSPSWHTVGSGAWAPPPHGAAPHAAPSCLAPPTPNSPP